MTRFLGNLKWMVIVSSALVLPFLVMELVNRRGFQEGFPVAVFALLWILPAVFVLLFLPVAQAVLTGKKKQDSPLLFMARVVLLIFIVWLWASTVIDQLPCFLGIRFCD